jgi:hypothetical protein
MPARHESNHRWPDLRLGVVGYDGITDYLELVSSTRQTNGEGSPAPTRTTSGYPWVRSTTVVGTVPHAHGRPFELEGGAT